MKDAYLSYKEDEIYLVLKSMKDFMHLQPQMSNKLDAYIFKLEMKIGALNNKKINQNAQRYITDKIHEAFKLPEPVLQLGMTFEETKSIQGVPQFIDTHTEKDQLFEMWTYPEGLEVSHLYFRDNMLIRIEK
jgi:hypothetical protein